MEPDQKDLEAIASVAFSVNRAMDERAKGTLFRSDAEKLYGRRIDFREHVNNYVPGRSLPPPQNYNNRFNHRNWQNEVPRNIPGWNSPYPEEEIDPSNLNLNTGPIKQYQIPPHIQQHVQQYSPGSYDGRLQSESFSIPDYDNPEQQSSSVRITLEDELEFRDALIKEIKALKKTINKLNRENEKLIVQAKSNEELLITIANHLSVKLPEKTETSIDENKDKS